MRIIDYQQDHLHDLMDGPLNDGAVKNIGYMKDWAETLQQPGFVDMWPGVGEAWFIASNKIHEYPRKFIRFAKTDVMQRVIDENGLWRVQAVCKSDWPVALKFARFMGFEVEGVMRKYGPEGMDYTRVAWVKK